MALRRRVNKLGRIEAWQSELAAALLKEWRDWSDETDAEPLIVIQRDAPGEPAKRLYVLWGDLTQVRRARHHASL